MIAKPLCFMVPTTRRHGSAPRHEVVRKKIAGAETLTILPTLAGKTRVRRFDPQRWLVTGCFSAVAMFRWDARVVIRRPAPQECSEENLMRSLICTASVMCLLVAAGVMSQGASDETPATIEKIMDTLHKGKKSTLAALKTALKRQSPDWAAVQKETKTYSKFAADLPKNDPPKGDPASFKKLAEAFAANAKTLNDAAQKEDLAAANAAIRKLVGSCNSCHDAHKED
jgi:cytochrome c556